MIKKFKFFAILATVIVLSLGVAIGASGIINIVAPTSDESQEAFLSPLLVPPDSAYSEIPAEQPITAPDDRLFAQLDQVPAGFEQVVLASFPQLNITEDANNRVSFAIISSIKYSGEKGWIVISVAKPSSTASSKGFLLGDQEIVLSNGTKAWATNDENDNEYDNDINQVAFLQDDLIISVISSLPVSEIQGLTSQITLNK
jgi:hypothetical protein